MASGVFDAVIVGGAGHVGLPLTLAAAAAGLRVAAFDQNLGALDQLRAGVMPFIEHGGRELLERVGPSITWTADVDALRRTDRVIVTIGTPVDAHLNPRFEALFGLFDMLTDVLPASASVLLRSTVYPGTCARLSARWRARAEYGGNIAYVPERIAQGYAVRELSTLPQIIAGATPAALESARLFFACIAPELVEVSLLEAELAKLFSNAYRYTQFAIANQFWALATEHGADFDAVRNAMTRGYGRAASLPTAGFAAGPCLLKDTLQLAAFQNANLPIAHAAMAVNEGLPGVFADLLTAQGIGPGDTVAILGMAFKADIDDTRESLSFRLRHVLQFRGVRVLCSDEHATNIVENVAAESAITQADAVVVAVPHARYRTLTTPTGKPVIDTWGVLRRAQ